MSRSARTEAVLNMELGVKVLAEKIVTVLRKDFATELARYSRKQVQFFALQIVRDTPMGRAMSLLQDDAEQWLWFRNSFLPLAIRKQMEWQMETKKATVDAMDDTALLLPTTVVVVEIADARTGYYAPYEQQTYGLHVDDVKAPDEYLPPLPMQRLPTAEHLRIDAMVDARPFETRMLEDTPKAKPKPKPVANAFLYSCVLRMVIPHFQLCCKYELNKKQHHAAEGIVFTFKASWIYDLLKPSENLSGFITAHGGWDKARVELVVNHMCFGAWLAANWMECNMYETGFVLQYEANADDGVFVFTYSYPPFFKL